MLDHYIKEKQNDGEERAYTGLTAKGIMICLGIYTLHFIFNFQSETD